MFRFIHSSDLHIGKRFGNMPEDVRGRLREARHVAIGRLAEQAHAHGASTILLAGDTFDSETPTRAMLRHTLSVMGEHGALHWVILPGNHDSLLADELWRAAADSKPSNVTLALDAVPIELAAHVVLLPAPCTTRRPGRDLTEWMGTAATPNGMLRIGLAHGAIQDFSEDGRASEVIAPDRAARAGLDYLALGDWHGQMRVNDRSWYSGAPEPDRFKHETPGQALLVSLAGPGAVPEVTPLRTGSFEWRTLELHLLAEPDGAATLAGLLPGTGRRQTLLSVRATGRTRLAARSALIEAFHAAEPDFAYAALDERGLIAECEAQDLDLIDRAGTLRQAAEALMAESADDALSAADREIAGGALARLFSYCQAARS